MNYLVFERSRSGGPMIKDTASAIRRCNETYEKTSSAHRRHFWIPSGPDYDFLSQVELDADSDPIALKLELYKSGAEKVHIIEVKNYFSNDETHTDLAWYLSFGRWTEKGIQDYDETRINRNVQKMASIGVYIRNVYGVIAGASYDTIALSQASSIRALSACQAATRAAGFVRTEFRPLFDLSEMDKVQAILHGVKG